MSHVPPWADATRFIGTCVEDFWLPYNVNYGMGNMIESIMKDNPNKNVTVLSGHTHVPAVIHVDNNINCFVQCGKYIGTPNDHNSLFI
jgi:UDP-2,3-diacylglucosamine pyrophosphatase LpxH